MGFSAGYSYSQSNNLELQKKKHPRSDKAPRKREMLRKIGLAGASSSMGVFLDGYLELPYLTGGASISTMLTAKQCFSFLVCVAFLLAIGPQRLSISLHNIIQSLSRFGSLEKIDPPTAALFGGADVRRNKINLQSFSTCYTWKLTSIGHKL